MQPQETNTPPADFGFMLNQQQPPAKKGAAGKFSSFGRPAKILIAAVAVLIVVIVAALVFGGGDSSSKQVLNLMVQNQEIARVSQAQDQKFSDLNTAGLSATTQSVMASQKAELADYLANAKVKYSEQQLAIGLNKNTDTELEAAIRNNNLDQAYVSYLKASLTAYSSSLQATYESTKSVSLKSTLAEAFNSVQTLLQSPQLKS